MQGLTNFPFRMPATFIGDVTRMTPAAIIEPCASDTTAPPTFLGQAVVVDATSGGVRPITPADTPASGAVVYGVTVRGFPMQPPNASGYFGALGFGKVAPWLLPGQPPGALDVLRQGYIGVQVNGTPRKGGRVWVWVAADDPANNHYQGGFEAAASGANTVQLPPTCTFQGSPGPLNDVELAFNVGSMPVQ